MLSWQLIIIYWYINLSVKLINNIQFIMSMESKNFTLKSKSQDKLLEKPKIKLDDSTVIDLRKMNAKVADHIEMQLKARDELTKKKYFLK